jgi:hypothetical protein
MANFGRIAAKNSLEVQRDISNYSEAERCIGAYEHARKLYRHIYTRPQCQVARAADCHRSMNITTERISVVTFVVS